MKIISVSCVFPNPAELGLGLFVAARLRGMAGEVRIKVIAPIPLADYSRLSGVHGQQSAVPAARSEGPLEIFHPRWLYLPGGMAVNPALLSLRIFPLLTRIRKQYPFDWIDAHFAFPDGIATALLARWFHVPFSITLRGNEPMHAARSKMIRVSMRWAFRRAVCIITVSESLRQFAISLGANPETARTIPNGVDHRIYYPRDRHACRSKLNVAANTSVIVSAGSLIERKGHHRIIQALSTLKGHGLNVLLLIVGGKGREGDYSSTLQKMHGELGADERVRFLGHITPPELAEIMSAADVFCLASSREGWPNVVHEAMACGTPVVATDVGGVPDLVPSSDYGFVVPAGNQDALEFALGEALQRSWDREAIRRWAHSRSWEQVAREVLEVFEEVKQRKHLIGKA